MTSPRSSPVLRLMSTILPPTTSPIPTSPSWSHWKPERRLISDSAKPSSTKSKSTPPCPLRISRSGQRSVSILSCTIMKAGQTDIS
ncbi:MAG: hypothetical protein E7463_15110 [Ruminococcaceae bacterium]|nr:hypothetical protein [Oscillospiraceae bacterium]